MVRALFPDPREVREITSGSEIAMLSASTVRTTIVPSPPPRRPPLVRWGLDRLQPARIGRPLRVALIVAAVAGEASSAAAAPPPLTLAEALATARERTVDLALARQRIAQAEVNVSRAWALLKPSWTANLSYTRTEPAPDVVSFPDLSPLQAACAGLIDDMGNFDPMVGSACRDALRALRDAPPPPRTLDFARQNVLNGSTRIIWTPLNGRAKPLIENAEDAVRLERQRVEVAERSQRQVVSRAYYAAVATRDAIAAAERAQRRAEERVEAGRARAAVGRETSSSLLAQDVARRQAGLDVARARNAHQQSLLGLAFVVGLDLPRDVVPPAAPSLPAETQEALIAQALEGRPEITSARLALTIAERRRTEVWWQFAPTIGFFGNLSASNLSGLTGRTVNASFGVVANLTLYDAGLRYAELDEAALGVRAAALRVEQVERQLRQEIAQAFLRIEAARLGTARSREAKRLAEERVSTARALLGAGAGRELDLDEALDGLATAELAIIRAGLDEALAVLELRQAAGLEDDPGRLPPGALDTPAETPGAHGAP